jgi:hypothetical protein
MKFNSNRSKIEKEEQMETLNIQTSMGKNRQVKFDNGIGIRHELEAMKLCWFMFAYIPSGNYRKFISMVVDRMDGGSTELKADMSRAIEAIAEDYEESVEYHSHDEEVMPVPDNMTEDEWEVVLARKEQVESN